MQNASNQNAPNGSKARLPGALGVMIENSPDARPQAGLDKADIVYEMESEGNITRFLALFHSQSVAKIGPVRSARMGFYDIALAYGVPYAHAGGSAEVLAELKARSPQLLNVDEIYTCSRCFWRSSERQAPHNLYTSTDRLVDEVQSKGFPLKPLRVFPVGPAPAGGRNVARFNVSWGPLSPDVSWRWDGRQFLRYQNDAPHVLEDGATVGANNVVVLFTTFQWDVDAEIYHVDIVGGGEGYLFRNGQAYPIHWRKASREALIEFAAKDGQPIRLAEGKSWIEVLKSPNSLKLSDSQ